MRTGGTQLRPPRGAGSGGRRGGRGAPAGRGRAAQTLGHSGVLPQSPPIPRPHTPRRRRELIITSPPRGDLHSPPYRTPTGEKWEDAERGRRTRKSRLLKRRKCPLLPAPLRGGRGRGPRPASDLKETCRSTEHARPAVAEGRSCSGLQAFQAAGEEDSGGGAPGPRTPVERRVGGGPAGGSARLA